MKQTPILLVEDNALDVKLVQRYFERAEVTNPIYTAWDGEEALEYLSGDNNRTKLSQPCVILLDLNMPRVNGFEFLEKMRAKSEFSRNVVFILTTSSRDEDKQAAYELNAAGYVLKDNLKKLSTMIAKYLDISEFPGSDLYQ